MYENENIETEALEYIKSLNFLCVEDDPTTRLIYEGIFEDYIDNVIYCVDGQDGYDRFLDNNIDIIITDYSMPVLNGLEMIKKIRRLNTEIPIILVSNLADVSVLSQAIELDIHSFISKPITASKIIDTIIKTSKLLIANKYLQEQRDKRINELIEKDKYNTYQEDLAFEKELNILKNDFYYQMLDIDTPVMIDLMYKPLDVVSGDAYSVRAINNNKTLYLVVDGMGKGLSASLSAMLMTSFINYVIDNYYNIDLNSIMSKAIDYIKPILLENEALSMDCITIDHGCNIMEYSKFSMPSLLLQDLDNKVIKIKSNNPPLSKYTKEFQISTYDISNIKKYLFYTDGIVENTTNIDNLPYEEFIYEDFSHAFTRLDLEKRFHEKIDIQEDDITFIFINKLDKFDNTIETKEFGSSLNDIEIANDWYCDIWENISDNKRITYNAGVVFSELFMNAFEHGNLGISSSHKHKILEDGTYFSTLEDLQTTCEKKITVSVNKVIYSDAVYIITKITDEGDGFETQELSEIFRNSYRFNGRGVLVSKSSSCGIYYNKKGNSVMYIHKI